MSMEAADALAQSLAEAARHAGVASIVARLLLDDMENETGWGSAEKASDAWGLTCTGEAGATDAWSLGRAVARKRSISALRKTLGPSSPGSRRK